MTAGRFAALVLVGSLFIASSDAGARGHHRGAHRHDAVVRLPRVRALAAQAAPSRSAVTVFVNGGGGTLSGGWDNSRSNASSIAYDTGGDVTVPAWSGGQRRWGQVMRCVRDRFSVFAVAVVDARPASGHYIMAMVGGQPQLVGYGDGVSGIAPHTGDVLRDAVVYVFSDQIDNDVEQVCVDVLHEVGHALGLDHEYLCEDPMSYLWGCGEKRFQDVAAACGEGEARECSSGEDSQNSWRQLAAAVGLRGQAPEEPVEEPAIEEPDVDEPADDWIDDDGEDAGPTLAITSPGGELRGDRDLTIVVVARDDRGVADVELGWASDDGQWLFSCDAMPDDLPARCERDGDTFRFQLRVGTGLRVTAARATDTAGQQAISDAQVLELR